MKETFYITPMAGRTVADKPNPGPGKTIELTAKQAAHPLRLGYLSRDPAVKPDPEPRPRRGRN